MTPEQLRADREARLQRLEAKYASVPLEPEDEEEEQPPTPSVVVPRSNKTGIPLEARQQRVARLLDRHGPLEWHILLRASGLTCTSLARVLKGERFVRKEDGRWGLK